MLMDDNHQIIYCSAVHSTLIKNEKNLCLEFSDNKCIYTKQPYQNDKYSQKQGHCHLLFASSQLEQNTLCNYHFFEHVHLVE